MTPFGEWAPDLPALDHPGLTVARNVYPGPGGLKAGQAFERLDARLTTLAGSAVTLADLGGPASGGTYLTQGGFHALFLGTATKLYRVRLNDPLFDDVSRVVGGAYTTSANTTGWGWSFTEINGELFAANAVDPVQRITLPNSTGQVFSALAGSPPVARSLARVGQFLVMSTASTAMVSAPKYSRVQWSGFGDVTQWAPTINQSDYQDLGEEIKTILGGSEAGLILTDRGLWRMVYTGPPEIFSFQKILDRGTPYLWGAVQVDQSLYFLSGDGPYEVVDGTRARPLGVNKIVDHLAPALVMESSAPWVAYDALNDRVLWTYQGAYNTDTSYLLVYDRRRDQWSQLASPINVLLGTPAFSLSLGGAYRALPTVYGVSVAGVVKSLSAAPAVITLETGEVGGAAMQYLNWVRPYLPGAGTGLTVAAGTRNALAESVVWSGAVSAQTTGQHNLRASGRYLRLRITGPSTTQQAVGYDLDLKASGRQ